jgi:hypothetical protein
MSPDATYNGYANYQTWNVCLWISNDQGLHELAASCDDYGSFTETLKEVNTVEDFHAGKVSNAYRAIAFQTPDMVAWNDSAVNLAEMQEYWKENFVQVEA